MKREKQYSSVKLMKKAPNDIGNSLEVLNPKLKKQATHLMSYFINILKRSILPLFMMIVSTMNLKASLIQMIS